jgi:hypothetical protein
VPIRATAPVEVGDWVLKIGHPLGYRKGRSAPVRLGRVIRGTEEIFGTDCSATGGDTGGPYFSLDGQLLGIMYRNRSRPIAQDRWFLRPILVGRDGLREKFQHVAPLGSATGHHG